MNKKLKDLSTSELIKNINVLEKTLNLEGISESTKQALDDLIFCARHALKLKTQTL